MERRRFRTIIFKMMFQMEFRDSNDLEEVISLYDDNADGDDVKNLKEKDKEQIVQKVNEMLSKQKEIDAVIESHSNGWKLARIGKAELAILRVAIYEILYDDTIPNPVAINEAVELAKLYTDDKAPGFINGILGQIEREK